MGCPGPFMIVIFFFFLEPLLPWMFSQQKIWREKSIHQRMEWNGPARKKQQPWALYLSSLYISSTCQGQADGYCGWWDSNRTQRGSRRIFKLNLRRRRRRGRRSQSSSIINIPTEATIYFLEQWRRQCRSLVQIAGRASAAAAAAVTATT